MAWQLQEAKARFSEVIQRARLEGPQTVTLRGQRAAVVLSAADYDRLSSGEPNFIAALLGGPAWGDEMIAAVNDRAVDLPRETDF
ncbi:MAG: type II toxin-antitoxin system Phd/YefM family antitoxin [Rhodospirillales bacterium]